MNARVGGRFVQVASTRAPGAPFGSFEHVSIVGYGPLEIERGNIYFAAVNPNPADAGATLLALFPVLLDGRATISAAVSCDGTRFSSLWPVYKPRAAKQVRAPRLAPSVFLRAASLGSLTFALARPHTSPLRAAR